MNEKVEYLGTVWAWNEADRWEIEAFYADTQQEAEQVTLAALRHYQRQSWNDIDGFDAVVERVRFIPDKFHDPIHGWFKTERMEKDRSFTTYSDGVTWYDDHDPSAGWEDA